MKKNYLPILLIAIVLAIIIGYQQVTKTYFNNIPGDKKTMNNLRVIDGTANDKPVSTTVSKEIDLPKDFSINWKTIKYNDKGISFQIPKEWTMNYSGPYTPDDIDIYPSKYEYFISFKRSNYSLDTDADIYIESVKSFPKEEKSLISWLNKTVSISTETKTLEDYTITNMPFENRIILSKRIGNGDYYRKSVWVKVNNNIIKFNATAGPKGMDEKEVQDIFENIDYMVKSFNIIK